MHGDVFSRDAARAARIADQIEAGVVLVNGATPELEAPVGGVNQSGGGREFGLFGLESFLEVKTIAVAA